MSQLLQGRPHLFLFFFFQAEDGIRDYKVTWSSDVCSSDLKRRYRWSPAIRVLRSAGNRGKYLAEQSFADVAMRFLDPKTRAGEALLDFIRDQDAEIGRASCRERV